MVKAENVIKKDVLDAGKLYRYINAATGVSGGVSPA